MKTEKCRIGKVNQVKFSFINLVNGEHPPQFPFPLDVTLRMRHSSEFLS